MELNCKQISNWILSNFFLELFFTFQIARFSNESSIRKIWLLHPIVGVEWNQTNFELIFIECFKYFLLFQINRIPNFLIELNEFQTNSNLTPPLTRNGTFLEDFSIFEQFYHYQDFQDCNFSQFKCFWQQEISHFIVSWCEITEKLATLLQSSERG